MGIDLTQFEGHTPGPWEPKRSEYFGTCVIQQGGLIVANLPNTKAEHIGFHVTCNGRGKDARLIAAAPDLLAEVKASRAAMRQALGEMRQALGELSRLNEYNLPVYISQGTLTATRVIDILEDGLGLESSQSHG